MERTVAARDRQVDPHPPQPDLLGRTRLRVQGMHQVQDPRRAADPACGHPHATGKEAGTLQVEVHDTDLVVGADVAVDCDLMGPAGRHRTGVPAAGIDGQVGDVEVHQQVFAVAQPDRDQRSIQQSGSRGEPQHPFEPHPAARLRPGPDPGLLRPRSPHAVQGARVRAAIRLGQDAQRVDVALGQPGKRDVRTPEAEQVLDQLRPGPRRPPPAGEQALQRLALLADLGGVPGVAGRQAGGCRYRLGEVSRAGWGGVPVIVRPRRSAAVRDGGPAARPVPRDPGLGRSAGAG